MRRVFAVAFSCALAIMVAGSVQAQTVNVDLKDAQGKTVGTAVLKQQPDGVDVNVKVSGPGIQAGEHGVHFHDKGECNPPDFASAGSHFNPASKSHGLENPQGPHSGDMPNMTVDAKGGNLHTKNTLISLKAGDKNSVMGKAIVVHAGKDDQKTDPSGASGARVACGVIK